MPSDLATAATALVERLLALAAQDAGLRGPLRQLAQAFLEMTAEPEADTAAQEPKAVPIAEQVQATLQKLEAAVSREANEPEPAPVPRVPLPELTLGRSRPSEPSGPIYPQQRETAGDLGLIESRCRLKAEGARWAATRRRLMADGASYDTQIEPKDRDIIARARVLPNCFLWMCHPSGPSPSNLALWEEVAGCFEAAAEATSLLKQMQDESTPEQSDFEAALDLLAESQSALRVAVGAIDGPADTDQNEIFHWLRATATEMQIFIRRYMRLDNPANPTLWPDLLQRIEEAAARGQEGKRRRGQRKRLLGKVRHKTTLILNDPEGGAGEWTTLIETICELIDGGLPASNREIRDLLIPVIEYLPAQESVPEAFERVLAEVDRFLATCPPPESSAVVKLSKEVTDAADLLRGKSLVLIGGEKRQGACQALKETFGLKDLLWIETRAHESFESFGPYVARPDVAAVLLAIRWSSHSYGEVKNFCDTYGKPLVRLPGGYNPNQVAAQLMSQASDRLR